MNINFLLFEKKHLLETRYFGYSSRDGIFFAVVDKQVFFLNLKGYNNKSPYIAIFFLWDAHKLVLTLQ
jgi:hypothetical protein